MVRLGLEDVGVLREGRMHALLEAGRQRPVMQRLGQLDLALLRDAEHVEQRGQRHVVAVLVLHVLRDEGLEFHLGAEVVEIGELAGLDVLVHVFEVALRHADGVGAGASELHGQARVVVCLAGGEDHRLPRAAHVLVHEDGVDSRAADAGADRPAAVERLAEPRRQGIVVQEADRDRHAVEGDLGLLSQALVTGAHVQVRQRFRPGLLDPRARLHALERRNLDLPAVPQRRQDAVLERELPGERRALGLLLARLGAPAREAALAVGQDIRLHAARVETTSGERRRQGGDEDGARRAKLIRHRGAPPAKQRPQRKTPHPLTTKINEFTTTARRALRTEF